MKAKEMRDQLRDMPDHELTEQIGDLRRRLLDLRFANATGELDDTAGLRRTKRDLARALTVARERALGIGREER
jgi:large subunit ribosomal protein L29